MSKLKTTIENDVSKISFEEIEFASRVATEVWRKLGTKTNERVGLEFIKVTFFIKENRNFAQFVMAVVPKSGPVEFEKIRITGVLGLYHVVSDDRVSKYAQFLVIFHDNKPTGTFKMHTDGRKYVKPTVIAKDLVEGIRFVLHKIGYEIKGKGTLLQQISRFKFTDSSSHAYPRGDYSEIEKLFTPLD